MIRVPKLLNSSTYPSYPTLFQWPIVNGIVPLNVDKPIMGKEKKVSDGWNVEGVERP